MAPREPNVIREALSSLPPPPAPASRSSIIAGLGLLQQASEAIEEDMKKKLHERWAHQQALRPIEDRALAAPPPPVDRSAPKQWPIERYIQENDNLRARAAKAEKEREAALVAARSAQERLDARSDAVVRLAEAQRTIAVQKGNIAALDDELKAARARPPGMCIPGCVRDDPHARARCIVPAPAPLDPLEPPPPGEWKLDPTWLPPMKVREYRVLPPVYGTVQLDAEALKACRGDKDAFIESAPGGEPLLAFPRSDEKLDIRMGRSAVASAPGIAPKRRPRPYPAVIDYARPTVAAAVVIGCQLDADFLANVADQED